MNQIQKPAVAASDDAPVRTKRRTTQEWIAEIHLWIGLILCLPLVVLGISGSYLTYHDTFDAWLSDGGAKVAAEGPHRPAVDIAKAATAAAPEGYSAVMLTLPEGDGDAATVRIAPQGAGFRDPRAKTLAIDPVSLDVLGEAGGRALLTGIMHDLHGHLMWRGPGRQIVGWLGVAMFILGVSGLVIWWPKPGKLRAALTIKKGARGYRLHRDLHGVFGFWGLSVFVLVTFTGIYIVFPQFISPMFGASTDSGDRPQQVRVKSLEGVAPMTLAEMTEVAVAKVPDAELVSVMMPFRPGTPARARFAVPGSAEGAPGITVSLDPWRRTVVEINDPRDFDVPQTLQAWQRPLHSGLGWGPIWQALVFVSGLLPLLFSITGIYMWVLKRRARKRSGR